jgi:site-specific DNA-methyltransferase (adenine-specific)
MSSWSVIHGDCLDVLKTIPSGSIDAVVTDPPYSSGGMVRGDRMASTRTKYQQPDVITEHPEFTGDNRDQRGFAYWVALWLSECRRVVKPGGMLCQFSDWRQLPTSTDAIQAGGWVWRGIVPWDKVVARPQPNRFRSQCEYVIWGTNGPRDFDTNGATYGDGFYQVTTTPTDEREHSTQKPVQLMVEVLKTACPEYGTVLDPFCGSGSTGVACVLTGRKFVGVELSEEYVAIARRRIGEAANHIFSRVAAP